MKGAQQAPLFYSGEKSSWLTKELRMQAIEHQLLSVNGITLSL